MKIKKLLSAILVLVMITGSMPVAVFAEDSEEVTTEVTEITEEQIPEDTTPASDDGEVSQADEEQTEEQTEEDTADLYNASDDEDFPKVRYIKRTYDPNTKEIISHEYDSPTYTKMSSLEDNSSVRLISNFWYVVDKDVTFNHRINVTGNVQLILVNGNTLTCNNGIHVAEGAKLNIYGQAGDNGKLVATTDFSDNAPLGGNGGEKAGVICIYGGDIKADAYSGESAAIGGGRGKYTDGNIGSPKGIYIYGGTINAFCNGEGSGIGGGHYGYASWYEGINIYGGNITTEGHRGAGIGNGSEQSGSTGDIRIYGGKVRATAFGTAAAIGGGKEGANGDIYIYGGYIGATATGSKNTGAGIGSGCNSNQSGYIYISGGIVTSTSRQGAGIGGGIGGDGGEITIEGGIITAASSQGGAGIGGGKGADGAHVVIRDGCITATSEYFDDSYTTLDKWISYGEHVISSPYGEGAIIIFALLYDLIRDTDICGAGIGGGYEGSGNDVEIYGGAVTAMSGYKGVCAIGWGRHGRHSGTVNLESGLKVADRFDDDTNPVFVKEDDRRDVILSQYAFIVPCDHSECEYYCADVATHDIDCKYCGEPMGSGNHEFGSDGKCIMCGATGKMVTVRFVEKKSSGEEVFHDRTVYLGSKFTLPQPGAVPEGMEFAGWVDDTTGHAYYAGDDAVLVDMQDRLFRAVYDNVTVASYIDAKGVERSVRARVITNNTVCFNDGWYVARENTSIDVDHMYYRGQTNIILSDGVKLDIDPGDELQPAGSSDSIVIYGQSGGTGKINIKHAALGTYTQYGGCVNIAQMISTGPVNICGGGYVSTRSSFEGKVYMLGGDIHIGRIDLSDELKLDWITPDISVCLEAIYRQDPGRIVIEAGREFADGSRLYSGTLTDQQMYMIEGNTLRPSDASLYGDPEWVWAADHSSAKAVFTPLSGGEAMEIEAEVYTDSKPARTYYTAVAEYHGIIYTDVREVTKKWNLFVSGTQVTGDNMNDIFGDGKVSYDVSTNTLNIAQGAVITPSEHTDGSSYGIRYAINRSVPFTIHLDGTGHITANDSSCTSCYGIGVFNANHNIDAKTVIEGNGILIISVYSLEKAYGIHSDGSRLKIEQADVRIDTAAMTEERSVSCGNLLLTDGANLTAFSLYSKGYALYASSIDMSSDSKMELDSANKAVNSGCEVKDGARALGATVVSKGGAESSWDKVTDLSYYEDVYFPDHLAPAGYSLTLDGSIGLNIFVDMSDLSEEEKDESYMTFEITGNGSCTERDSFDSAFYETDGDKIYHGFTCRISSIQMADTISFTWHYGSGKSKTFRYSVREYLEYFDGRQDQYDEETIALVHALSDYGHYVQPYLADENGWVLGTDYAEMTAFYRGSYDYDEVSAALSTQVVEADFADTAVTMVTYRLRLDSSIALEVIMNVSGGNAVTCDDYPVSKAGSGRYKITIDGINAADLDKPLVITGNAGGSYSLTLSPLCYVKAVMSGSGHSSVSRNAMASLYYYYKAAEEYN